jgi:hypothetical protein
MSKKIIFKFYYLKIYFIPPESSNVEPETTLGLLS